MMKKRPISATSGVWILIVAAVVLEATACVQYFSARAGLRAEAKKYAELELRGAEYVIESHAIEMETAARALAMLAEKHVNIPDSIFAATRSVVGILTDNTSIAVAYVPDYFPKKGKYFEACSSRFAPDNIYTRQIGSADHDYTQMPWYQNGFLHEDCWWSEPYLDDSGSKTYVVSCSYPVHGKNGQTVAVVCVDLSLAYLQELSSAIEQNTKGRCSIQSAEGQNIVKAEAINDDKYEHFTEIIDATGWVITLDIPHHVIYAELQRVSLIVSVMQLIGLIFLVIIIYASSQNIAKVVNLSNEQDRMESELNIARNIQMAMLPTRFPPFPDYPNLNAHGVVIPAKEVGGDLFDFYLRDNKLLFCIGDVSGKGVPASLVMAMTRSLFRSLTSYIDSPAQIVTQMNDSLSGEGNEQNMFVTLFLGILDLTSGELQYSNAGHDAPIRLHFGKEPFAVLNCVPNLPLGVLSGYTYVEQKAQIEVGDTLFLFTDGLTEAENTDKELFGEQRIHETIRQWNAEMTAADQIEAMQAAVNAFVGEAQQSDDLTMFAIRLTAKGERLEKMEKRETSHHSLVMRNDIQQIPTLAEWVDSIGLPESLTMPINLALEEAVSNVMLYAYPNKSGQVLVEAEKGPKKITFVISDHGIPFDPTQQEEPDITKSAEERPIGGLGIFLVRQIMDSIRYKRKENKNILTLTKKL